MKCIFGPVHSRRFGVSLGVDLSPSHKQCNFDCLYCELAPAATVDHQNQTVSVAEIIAELKTALHAHANIDVITVTANGEPTLYPYLDALITEIDTIKGGTQTLILTNSAALCDANVFETLLRFDRVKLSLDAVTPMVFKKIDRPHEGIDIAALKEAVIAFSKRYRGTLYLEILFVHGLNDTDEEIAALNEALLHMDAERIDIGTIDRPPAYPVQGLSYSELHTISQRFDRSLPVHIASRTHAESCVSSYSESEIINTLDKRPLTMEDLQLLFDESSLQRLQALKAAGKIVAVTRERITFFMPANNLQRKRSNASSDER